MLQQLKLKNPTNLTLRNFGFQKLLERLIWHISKFVSGVKVKIFEEKFFSSKFSKIFFSKFINVIWPRGKNTLLSEII